MTTTTSVDLNTLTKGQRVIISNGEPEPPKHHKRKHALWERFNRSGYFSEYEAEYNNILLGTNPQCIGIVMATSLEGVTVSLPD